MERSNWGEEPYIESRSYLEDGRVFEYTVALYRGDRNKFTFELTRKKP